MSNKFNKFEIITAKFLSKFPGIKNFSKKYYQKICFLINKPSHNYNSKYEIKKITINNQESFFGYYDKSPINKENNLIIYHLSDKRSTKKLPSTNIPIKIILYDLINDKHHYIDKSYSYNWQQGSKLQWLTKDKFIFNCYINNSFKSKIYNVTNMKIEKLIDYPIYDCYTDEYALSLNFSRLSILNPDYGYINLGCNNLDELEKDGIYYISLIDNSKKLLISYQQIIDLYKQKSFKNTKHTFNHIMISPNGKRFMFIHRWFTSNNKKYDSLILSDISGSVIQLLANDGMVSHCCWFGNDKIVGYLRDSKLGDNFYLIDIYSKMKKILSNKLSNFGDGHPSFYKDKMLFDSYPDKSRLKYLYIFDKKIDAVKIIGDFFESFSYYNQTRCDLHPRWSNDGIRIFFDSVHEGKRYLFYFDIKNDYLNNL